MLDKIVIVQIPQMIIILTMLYQVDELLKKECKITTQEMLNMIH